MNIQWPTIEEMEESTAIVKNRRKGHLFKGTFPVTDGIRMPCLAYVDTDVQNAFWEGFIQAHEFQTKDSKRCSELSR